MSIEAFRGSRSGCYKDFVEHIQRSGLHSILGDYPIAHEAIDVLAAQTRRFASEFTSHYEEDQEPIRDLLGQRHRLELREARTNFSDPHRGGRTVVRLSFNCGRQIYYKPRSVAVDRVWLEGLIVFNRGLSLPLIAPRVLDAGDHGWSEAIPVRDDLSESEIRAFYRRFGMLLCIAWLLDAIDLHGENIVASGPLPVLIDAECLLHPFAPGEETSLVRTGLLPNLANPFDGSALTEVTRIPPIHGWSGFESDDLRQCEFPGITTSASLPRVDGKQASPQTYAGEIESGFTEAADFAVSHKQAIESWRNAISLTPRRLLKRPTSHYSLMLMVATEPQHLTAKALWEKHCRDCFGGTTDPQTLKNELEQLSRWDVPIFQTDGKFVPGVKWERMSSARAELSQFLRL